MHAHRSEAKAAHSAKLRRMGVTDSNQGEGFGMAAHPPKLVEGRAPEKGDEPLNADRKNEPPSTPRKFKRGGAVEGEKSKTRMDRPCRAKGGRVKGKTTVNVIVAPQGAQAGQGAPASVPMPVGPPNGAMPPPPPPRPMPMPIPVNAQAPPGAVSPPMMRKRGGAVPKMDAGAGSGVGRLEKTRMQERAG